MNTFLSIVLATGIVSLLGLVGVFSLYMKEKTLKKITNILVAFAAGAMLGGAFLHMFPKSLEKLEVAPELFILGFISFFLLERFIHWHHCHKLSACEVHPVSYLTIIGDAIHNFVDGLVIAASFLTGKFSFGIITTFMIIAHELPQELGNFAVLLHSGFKKIHAILWTFISQLTCLLGGIFGYFFLPLKLVPWLIAFAGGGFVYIGASDLVPELHHEKEITKVLTNFLMFLLGIAFLEAVKFYFHH